MLSDGEVFSWRWKNKERDADCAPFRSYHCYSRIAIARDGKLFDTFWCGSGTRLERGDITTKLLGNLDEMREIGRWETNCYRREDIIDMRHSNNTGAKVYVQKDAKRHAKTMTAHINYLIEDGEGDIRSANHRIDMLRQALEKVGDGRLDEVYF